MRYDKKIELIYNVPGEYDPKTGNYSDSEKVVTAYASIMDTGLNDMNMVYQKIIKGSKTVQLQNHIRQIPDYIRIGDKRYKVDFSRRLALKQTFIVSEAS